MSGAESINLPNPNPNSDGDAEPLADPGEHTTHAAAPAPDAGSEGEGLVGEDGFAVAGRVSSPVPGHRVTYRYGIRNPRYRAGYHTGDDYAARTGTPVVAVRAGTIAWADTRGASYGTWIGLRADNGRDYIYCHLSKLEVKTGTRVRAGQRIGRVGATGSVTGPHLHFEDRPRGGRYGQDRKPRW
ncbi:M23 family metallopeptidase [Streptomyces yaizuensis]|uniref:Peptidoglycan DD-metalloendopeptidase family protein n=1 Tax=Streptomyces yaizuensis TaxID=2989713 RepID=A0ABQ5PBM1_9ACTN|nr:M23 family metallopeptidase [Streptomyces sp. YSPA8]GLF99908.1 peptidoglycan DD-metalloendopeptidase family protein [Streptomyces sp. YSPA8]